MAITSAQIKYCQIHVAKKPKSQQLVFVMFSCHALQFAVESIGPDTHPNSLLSLKVLDNKLR